MSDAASQVKANEFEKGMRAMLLHDVIHVVEIDVTIIRVIGGWIYSTIATTNVSNDFQVTSVFVPEQK